MTDKDMWFLGVKIMKNQYEDLLLINDTSSYPDCPVLLLDSSILLNAVQMRLVANVVHEFWMKNYTPKLKKELERQLEANLCNPFVPRYQYLFKVGMVMPSNIPVVIVSRPKGWGTTK